MMKALPVSTPISVQIFGLKSSNATRAAERFFKERRVQVHFVDLKIKPMSPGEIRKFVDRFGLDALIDTGSKAYEDGGFRYLKMSDSEMLGKIENDPKLLKMPLVRCGKLLGIGQDEELWKRMVAG